MPREEGVQVHIGYMTRPYRRRPEHLSGKQAIVMARGGAAIVSQLGAAKARWQTHLSQLECRADEVERDAAATSSIADGALLP